MNILEYTNQEILALLPNEVYDNFIGAFCLKFEYDLTQISIWRII